jgi:hypothetical protein
VGCPYCLDHRQGIDIGMTAYGEGRKKKGTVEPLFDIWCCQRRELNPGTDAVMCLFYSWRLSNRFVCAIGK